MHYMIFSANFLPNIGGVERFTDGLSGALVEMGHQVTIVTNNTFGLASTETLRDGIDIIRLPCFPLIGGRMPLPKPSGEFRSLWRSLQSLKFDGVIVNTRFYAHSLLGVWLARRHGLTPLVLDHGSAYLTFGNPILDVMVRLYEHGITALVKRFNPNFYGISLKSVEWLKTFGIQALGVINNSIDAASYRLQASNRSFREELAISADCLLVTFTGRFIPEKGISVLIEMMRLLEDEPIHLVMAGDGPLRKMVDESCLENIHIVGRLDAPDIASLLMDSDLFCLPTRSEGFSTSLLEAVACGTPFLSTDVGGARELAPDDSYGFVMESADAAAFASVVRAVANKKEDLKVMGVRCRQRAESQCSWQFAAERVVSCLSGE